MHLLNLCISKLDILDIVFIGFCLLGLVVSICAHFIYELLYPKGTESRQLWSPLAQHPGFLAPDLHNSPDTCGWLSCFFSWLCHNSQSQAGLGGCNVLQARGILLSAVNETASGTAIVFLDISFGDSMPSVKSVTAKICAGVGKELQIYARVFAPELRLKVRVTHWQREVEVRLLNCNIEAELELRLAPPSTAWARLIGRPVFGTVQIHRIDSPSDSNQSESIGQSDWLVNRVIALLGSTVVRFPLPSVWTPNTIGFQANSADVVKFYRETICQTEQSNVSAGQDDVLSIEHPKFEDTVEPIKNISLANESPLQLADAQNKPSTNQTDPLLSSNSASRIDALNLTNQCDVTLAANQNRSSLGASQNALPELTNKSCHMAFRHKYFSRLLVKVIRASGLSVPQSAGPGHRATVVVLELDEPKQSCQTRPAYGITNPYWDEPFVFDLNPTSDKLTVSLQRQPPISASLSLADLPASGARVVLPLPQSAKITLELLALPAPAQPAESAVSAEGPLSLPQSPVLSRQIAEFMRPPPDTPKPLRPPGSTPCAEQINSNNVAWRKSDYSYARQYRNKSTMDFQMSYKKAKNSRSRSMMDRIGRALTRSEGLIGRPKW